MKILIPVDGSVHADEVLRPAVDRLKRAGVLIREPGSAGAS